MSQIGTPLVGSYDYGEVARSILISIAASYAALDLGGRITPARGRARATWMIGGAIAMGSGIAAMHYVGMAAMRLAATTRFDPLFVALSVVLAILFSRIALMFTFDYREDFRGTTLAKVISVAVMRGAISLMHYTGKAAASFVAKT
jgi:NO-binding membrane sensor protein with MHYT domain